MHLGGAAAEESGGVEVERRRARGPAGMWRSSWLGEEDGTGPRSWAGAGGGDAVVVAGEFVEGPLPAVAFVFDEALQHGEGGGLAVVLRC